MRGGMICAAMLLSAGAARAQDAAEPQREQASTAQGEAEDAEIRRQDEGAQQAQRGAEQPLPPGRTSDAERRQAASAGETSDAFERACIDLLQGRTPEGEKAIRALQDACRNLMAGRAGERIETEEQLKAQAQAREQLRLIAEGRAQSGQQGQPRVQPGQAAEPVEPGSGVLAAFAQAGRELVGGKPPPGAIARARRPVTYSLVTNPVGWFNGLGVNIELYRVFEDAPKFSWMLGGRYSTTDATNGTASTFGLESGVDLFFIGRNNAGFRIGPRAELAAGRERFQGSTTFARLGLAGETGYNFVASNGITGLLAVGVGGRVAGNDKNDEFASFVGGELGPYIKVGFGYSW